MSNSDVEWAGVRFTPMFHHDGHFFRCPGLYAFVRCGPTDERTLLFVDHTDNIAAATVCHPLWVEALRLGFNELNVNTEAAERTDRLLLRGHIVKRCSPILNLVGGDAGPEPLSLWPGWRSGSTAAGRCTAAEPYDSQLEARRRSARIQR